MESEEFDEEVICETCGSNQSITNSRHENKQTSILCKDCGHITITNYELYLKVLETFKIKNELNKIEGDDLK